MRNHLNLFESPWFDFYIGTLGICLILSVYLFVLQKEKVYLYSFLYFALTGSFFLVYLHYPDQIYIFFTVLFLFTAFCTQQLKSKRSYYHLVFWSILILFCFFPSSQEWIDPRVSALVIFLLPFYLTVEMILFILTPAKRLNQMNLKNIEYKIATEAKSRFLANMSHEIRTPLNAVLGMGELLQSAKLTREENQYLEVLRNAGENLMNLINDILDISKIESNKIELEKIQFSPYEIIKSTIQFIESSANRKGLFIRQNIEKNLPECLGDPTRIRQILVNLLSNAVKFTERGSIRIKICRFQTDKNRHPGIILTEKRDTLLLFLLVEDTGVGIPTEKWESIFDAFNQADPGTTRRFGGTGLGLAIIRRLVELMGGRIWVNSIYKQGSKFYCVIPLEIAPEKMKDSSFSVQSEKKKENASMQKRALTILLAEDNPDNQLLFQAYLKATNHTIITADNGKDAITMFQEHTFDLVFMDIQMPIMDGLEAVQTIRSWEEKKGYSRKTPIYALTAHALKQEVDRSLSVGCSGHLTKPLKREEFVQVIQNVQQMN